MTSANVPPSCSVGNPADGASLKSKFIGNGLMRLTSVSHDPDLAHKVVRKFGGVVVLALLASVTLQIEHISFSGVPSKVFEAIVAGVSIVVASFLSYGARTHKGFQNESMHITHLSSSKGYNAPAVVGAMTGRSRWLELSPSITQPPPIVSL
jgi:hypothetical protein